MDSSAAGAALVPVLAASACGTATTSAASSDVAHALYLPVAADLFAAALPRPAAVAALNPPCACSPPASPPSNIFCSCSSSRSASSLLYLFPDAVSPPCVHVPPPFIHPPYSPTIRLIGFSARPPDVCW